jgi:hypothetical protein
MLVFNVVCFLKMPFSRNARECHAEPAPRGLPDGTRDTSIKETVPAAAAIDSRSRRLSPPRALALVAEGQSSLSRAPSKGHALTATHVLSTSHARA